MPGVEVMIYVWDDTPCKLLIKYFSNDIKGLYCTTKLLKKLMAFAKNI